jgi:hypothetical protein
VGIVLNYCHISDSTFHLKNIRHHLLGTISQKINPLTSTTQSFFKN